MDALPPVLKSDAAIERGFQRLLALSDESGWVSETPGVLAIWNLMAGDPEAAVRVLAEAQPTRDYWMAPWLHEMPVFDPLQDRPDFQAVVERIGVAPKQGP